MSKMNHRVAKFLGKKSEAMQYVEDSVGFQRANDVLLEAKECYDGLDAARAKRRRNRRYTFPGDIGQWSDTYEGDTSKTEAQHIAEQGKTPLQFNQIYPTVVTILGQFRSNQTESICVARDRDEQKVGEMMTIGMQYAYQLNDLWEMDASNLLEGLISGVDVGKITYGEIPAIQMTDIRYENKTLPRMFFNKMVDPRGWDCRIIGELHDMELADVLSEFSKGSKRKAKELVEMYNHVHPEVISNMYGNLTTIDEDRLNFFMSSDTKKCRVIEVWKLESRSKLRCHDTLKGEIYWTYTDQEAAIIQENTRRTEDAARFGIEPMLINYEWGIHRFWYYRFLSPYGDVLAEGETPYWHKSHPYIIKRYLSIDGEVNSFVENIIDLQKMLNRNMTLADFIIGASAKGLLMIAEGTLPEGYTPEMFAQEYKKVGGVILYKPRIDLPDGGIPKEIMSKSSSVGVSEMISLIRTLLPDTTGVHGALQGKQAKSGVSGRLYEAEAQNASINLVETFELFKSFRLERDKKIMQVIQQYWDEPRYLNIAGKSYSEQSKWWNPEKVKNIEVDLSISESTSSVNYRTMMNEYLMELWKNGAISVKTMLSESSLPFADKVLQSIESEEAQMMQAQAQQENQMQGVQP